MSKPKVELLAPARDADTGIAAINSGSDAVYIGAPRFGARSAAGNTIEDIERLACYAHKFNCRVLATLNTLLSNEELRQANSMAWDLYNAGVDALIIQDFGLLETNLPPIRLHASTQCNNTTAEHVRWLQEVGFSRVVLARELSIEEIRRIREATDIELEAFVHGALCVSYSGECYMSECLRGRSANRGECAQMCRLPYDLLDTDGNELIHGKHLLSLCDMDRSAYLKELIDAGVTTFKIEGRLKDESYVKNIVSYYHNILQSLPDISRPSCGTSSSLGDANPAKTFHRSATDYFLHDRSRPMANHETPKSTGEQIGTVAAAGQDRVTIKSDATVNTGDGICIGSEGFQVQEAVAESGRITLIWDRVHSTVDPSKLHTGQTVFRNYDREFSDMLSRFRPQRKRQAEIHFEETADGFRLTMTTDGISASKEFTYQKETAQNTEKARLTVKTQLGKLGDTIFEIAAPPTVNSGDWFLPISVLNDWRRQVARQLEQACTEHCERLPQQPIRHAPYYSDEPLDYRANIHNDKAAQFYNQCEAVTGPDITTIDNLMRCRYCLKYELGWCKNKQQAAAVPKEPLYLRTGGEKMRLQFDCKRCEMRIKNNGAGHSRE